MHNDLDEGFIDEDESTHSNIKMCASTSQDIPDVNNPVIKQGKMGPNKDLGSPGRKAFRYNMFYFYYNGIIEGIYRDFNYCIISQLYSLQVLVDPCFKLRADNPSLYWIHPMRTQDVSNY